MDTREQGQQVRDGRPFRRCFRALLSATMCRQADGAFIFEDSHGKRRKLGLNLDLVFSDCGAGKFDADLILGSFLLEDAYSEDLTNAYFGKFIIQLRVLTL